MLSLQHHKTEGRPETATTRTTESVGKRELEPQWVTLITTYITFQAQKTSNIQFYWGNSDPVSNFQFLLE